MTGSMPVAATKSKRSGRLPRVASSREASIKAATIGRGLPSQQGDATMWRSMLGVALGFFVGGIVAFLIELPGMILYPLPPGTDMSNMEAIKSHMAGAPLWAIAGVAIAWTIAPLVAAWLAVVIACRAPVAH